MERTIHFAFYSDPWVNLHHFLFQWAFAETERRPGDYRRVLEVPERSQILDLSEPERAAWARAVGYYARHLVGKNLTWDRDLVEIGQRLTAISCSGLATAAGLPAELRGDLSEVMPIYQRHWWKGHQASNAAWIRELKAGLEGLEARLGDQLAQAYGGEWPAEELRIDVTTYANHTKGYTTNHPDHITLTSTDPDKKGWLGVETIFHESSHISNFEDILQAQLESAFARQGAQTPENLLHVIQFVTPANLLRALLRARGVGTYQSYAERVKLYERTPWDRYHAVVEQHWNPFLAGKVERSAALDGIAKELRRRDDSVPQPSSGSPGKPLSGRASIQ